MTNPDNVGGLPNEMGFEQWYVTNTFDYPNNPIGCRDCSIARKAWHAALEAARDGELCRAAPAGPGEKGWLPDLPKPAYPGYHTGTGKYSDDQMRAYGEECSREAFQLYVDANEARIDAERELALLRKLQQGADGWRPIESAPKEDGLKILGASNAPWTQDYYPVLVYEGYRHGSNKQYFGWQAPFDHDDRAPDPTHWMPLPAPPASQDQEGGHAEAE